MSKKYWTPSPKKGFNYILGYPDALIIKKTKRDINIEMVKTDKPFSLNK